jgi:hypothetical protein
MKSYNEIKEEELEKTKNYSDKKLKGYIKSHRILKSISSEFSFWLISFVVFMLFALIFENTVGMYLLFLVSHLLYWRWIGIKWFKREMTELNEELELAIEVLEDIQKERNEK